MKWEYLTWCSPLGIYSYELEEIGNDGWELVSVVVEGGQGVDPPT